ncbi:DNA-3-methyladenine glycosylase [Tessaracoccus sp. Z1128]
MILVPPAASYPELPARAVRLLEAVAREARALLGGSLTVDRDGERVTLRITEVEAYGGGYDPASHAYRGPSARNAAMFGPPRHAYVYRHMGLHTCFNAVVAVDGTPTGVLIRAGEVIEGVAIARARRAAAGVTRRDTDLAAGPARLTVAMGITLADAGAPLDGSTGLLLSPRAGGEPGIAVGPRIGVGRAADFPLRFWIDGDPTVSR